MHKIELLARTLAEEREGFYQRGPEFEKFIADQEAKMRTEYHAAVIRKKQLKREAEEQKRNNEVLERQRMQDYNRLNKIKSKPLMAVSSKRVVTRKKVVQVEDPEVTDQLKYLR